MPCSVQLAKVFPVQLLELQLYPPFKSLCAMRTSSRIWRTLPVHKSALNPVCACLRPKFTYGIPLHTLQESHSRQPSTLLRFSRYQSTSASFPASSRTITKPNSSHTTGGLDQPTYQLTFTCKPCKNRSSHHITKQGYHHGTVLITCPGCKARHLISDHLRVFVDASSDLEDILMRKAAPGTDLSKLLKRGKLGIRQGEMVGNEGEESIEFWDDGTQTTHQPLKNQ